MIFTKNVLEKLVLVILLFCCFGIILFDIYNKDFVCISILGIEIYMLFKSRKNIYLFFCYLCFFYFDYSVIFGKYIGKPISRLTGLYIQLPSTSPAYYQGIVSLLIFHIIISLCITKIKNTENFKIINEEKKYAKSNLISLVCTFGIAFIVVDYVFFKFLIKSRQIYEYANILFVFGFYLSQNNKKIKNILIILMLISTASNALTGGRVISLMPMICYFVLYIVNKINYRQAFVFFVMIVIVYTAHGLYGDIVDYNVSYKEAFNSINISSVFNAIKDRKFTLDTSVSAYFTGITFIQSRNYIQKSEVINNFLKFLTTYTILGGKSGYVNLVDISSRYFLHYNGGYITSFFFFWLGYYGVFLIGIYIGILLNIIATLDENTSEFKRILIIYIISEIPRWYLYYPTPLFRGMMFLIVLYIVFFKVLNYKNSI